jgi:hypothetical protein
MRVPPKETSLNQSSVKTVHIDKPIIIPRLPVTTTDKQRVKLTKQIESYCRSSLEYTDLITYLHKYVDMNECTFMNEFKGGKKKGMIEIHHSPFTLFSIVDVVMRKHEDQIGYIDELKVAEEVMRLHYSGLVGLIPLSVTCHQLVHDNQLPVPLWCVYGRFVEFTKRYYDWIPDELLMALDEKVQESRRFKAHPEELREALKILYVQFVYLDVDGETNMEDGVDPSMLKSFA